MSHKFSFIIGLICISGLSGSRVLAQSHDEPDFRKEKKFHNFYKNFNAKPTDEQTWSGVVSGKAHVYSIQDEDTLWDLSETLFGDSKYWPKVWSLNADKIQNPHEIFPGQVVQFTPGTAGDAPILSVRDKSEAEKELALKEAQESSEKSFPTEETEPMESGLAPQNRELLLKAEIPPPGKKKPLTKLPNSMPNWTMGARVPKLEFQVNPMKRRQSPNEGLSYFVESQHVSAIGTVTETELVGDLASDFQIIYVKLNSGSSEKRLLAVEESGLVQDPQTGRTAHMVQVQGEIEIQEAVNSSENIYRALVKKTVNPVHVGAKLVVGQIPEFTMEAGNLSSGSARIIGAQYAEDRKILAFNSIVFLNGQGLVEGQTYPIYKQHPLRNAETKVSQNPRQIGLVKVVRLSNDLATGVIIQSTDVIQIGDVTSPQMKTE